MVSSASRNSIPRVLDHFYSALEQIRISLPPVNRDREIAASRRSARRQEGGGKEQTTERGTSSSGRAIRIDASYAIAGWPCANLARITRIRPTKKRGEEQPDSWANRERNREGERERDRDDPARAKKPRGVASRPANAFLRVLPARCYETSNALSCYVPSIFLNPNASFNFVVIPPPPFF